VHNSLTIFALIVLGLALNHVFGIGEVLMNFLLFGMVPYSDTSLSPTLMLSLITIIVLSLFMHFLTVRSRKVRTWRKSLSTTVHSMVTKPAKTTKPKQPVRPVSKHVISKF
jgi:uncharacterized membrane protein YcaP (DUF421 family)